MVILFNKFSKADLSYYLHKSQMAMRELTAESFNSKTLKTFFTEDAYKTTKPNTVIVQSRATEKPVEIVYECIHNISKKFEDFTFSFFRPNDKSSRVAMKDFVIERSFFPFLKPKFDCGLMQTNVEDFVGLGVRADELQVKEAISKGVSKISRMSTPKATLYHVRMGYLPKPELVRVRSSREIMSQIFKMTQFSDIDRKFYTPIIVVKKGLFGPRYYIDTNTTQAIANIRHINYVSCGNPLIAKGMHFSSDHIRMELSGKNFDTWRRMIDGTYDFSTEV